MKTRNNKLDFRKHTVTELNDSQMNIVNGGSSPACLAVSILAISPALSTTLFGEPK